MSAHTPGPWFVFHGDDLIVRADCGDNVARVCEYGLQSEIPDAANQNARFIAASPRVADALWSLMVALGKHAPDMTQAQLADICPACDEATAALIESGRVLG